MVLILVVLIFFCRVPEYPFGCIPRKIKEVEEEDEEGHVCSNSCSVIRFLTPGLLGMGIRIVRDFYCDSFLFYKGDVHIGSLNSQELDDFGGSFRKVMEMIQEHKDIESGDNLDPNEIMMMDIEERRMKEPKNDME